MSIWHGRFAPHCRLTRRGSLLPKLAVYSMEEMVAELGAAFLSGDLGITTEPRAEARVDAWFSHALTTPQGRNNALATRQLSLF